MPHEFAPCYWRIRNVLSCHWDCASSVYKQRMSLICPLRDNSQKDWLTLRQQDFLHNDNPTATLSYSQQLLFSTPYSWSWSSQTHSHFTRLSTEPSNQHQQKGEYDCIVQVICYSPRMDFWSCLWQSLSRSPDNKRTIKSPTRSVIMTRFIIKCIILHVWLKYSTILSKDVSRPWLPESFVSNLTNNGRDYYLPGKLW